MAEPNQNQLKTIKCLRSILGTLEHTQELENSSKHLSNVEDFVENDLDFLPKAHRECFITQMRAIYWAIRDIN